MGLLRIITDSVQSTSVAFRCDVRITGGGAFDTVTVHLHQTAGMPPSYSATSTTTLNGAGDGIAPFPTVTLSGPTTAQLVADDDISATPLHADAVYIRVV
jgi:hypothetical protein